MSAEATIAKEEQGAATAKAGNETTKRIGLLLGPESCWPAAYEAMMRRLDLHLPGNGKKVNFHVKRVEMDPFSLTDECRYDLVVDRLTHWYKIAREWLKKASLMNDCYLLNNPFTFQAMEKHSAFCAMLRLGMPIPETWIIPQKEYPEYSIYKETAKRYNRMFNLNEIAEHIGYPLYLKPYDGGGWRGVSRITNPQELVQTYDDSGQNLMHLQKAVEPFDVFVRSLSVGPQCLPMHYDPSQPLHARYLVDFNFLSEKTGKEIMAISKIINAFFRWEYNSCEALVQDGACHPIDYANACPDSSLTSLHFYFPWVITALIRWTTFCASTDRKMRLTQDDMGRYFEIADDKSLTWEQKLPLYEALADEYFQTEEFLAFSEKNFKDLDRIMWEFVGTEEFDHILVAKVKDTFPEHEHDMFTAHYRGLLNFWRHCNEPKAGAAYTPPAIVGVSGDAKAKGGAKKAATTTTAKRATSRTTTAKKATAAKKTPASRKSAKTDGNGTQGEKKGSPRA